MLLLAIATLGACKPQQEIDDPSANKAEVNLSARIYVPEWAGGANHTSAGGPNRVHLGPDMTGVGGTTPLYWSEGDQINVWHVNPANGQEDVYSTFSLVEGAGTPNGRFRGKAVIEGQVDLTDAEGVDYGIYPASAMVAAETDGDYAVFTFPATQTHMEPVDGNATIDPAASIMVAKYLTAEQRLQFAHTAGILMLKLKGTQTITAMTLQATDQLYGTFGTYIKNDATPCKNNGYTVEGINYLSGGGTSLPLTIATPVTLNETTAQTFMFTLPTGVLSNGFTVNLTFSDGSGTITTSRANTIERGLIKAMPELDLIANTTMTWVIDDLFDQGAVTEW